MSGSDFAKVPESPSSGDDGVGAASAAVVKGKERPQKRRLEFFKNENTDHENAGELRNNGGERRGLMRSGSSNVFQFSSYWELRLWLWLVRTVLLPCLALYAGFSIVGSLIQQCPPEMCLYPGIVVRNGRVVSFLHSLSVCADTRRNSRGRVRNSGPTLTFFVECAMNIVFKFVGGIAVSLLIGAKPVVFSSPRHILFIILAHSVVQINAVYAFIAHKTGITRILLGAVQCLYRYRKVGFIATQLLVRSGWLPKLVCFICCVVSILGSSFARELVGYMVEGEMRIRIILKSTRLVLAAACATTVIVTESCGSPVVVLLCFTYMLPWKHIQRTKGYKGD